MRIEKNQSNTNFGYNKLLNKMVIGALKNSTHDKAYCDAMLKMNTLANSTENMIRKADKLNDQSLVDKLVDIFLHTKVFFANVVNETFPTLNYLDNEIASYKKEAEDAGIQSPEHWLNTTVTELSTPLEDSVPQVLQYMILPASYLPNTEYETEEEYDEAALGGINNAQAPKITQKDSDMAKSVAKGKDLVKEYVPTEISKKGFEALGGMKELKELLNERIVNILKDPQQAKLDEIEYGKKIPKGILLYGPPGCGKTTITEHLSTEADVPLLKLEVGSLGSKYIHETSENIDAAFDYAEYKAKIENKPVLLFIDDADAMFSERQSGDDTHTEELSTFLNRIQKSSDNNIMVIAATNKYDLLDEAIRSRFEEQILVNLPDKDARKSIIKKFMESRAKGIALSQDEKSLEELAEKTSNFSIRTMKMMADKASLTALKDGRRDINASDWEKIIKDSEKMKVKSNKYETKADRGSIGFAQIASKR